MDKEVEYWRVKDLFNKVRTIKADRVTITEEYGTATFYYKTKLVAHYNKYTYMVRVEKKGNDTNTISKR